MWMMAIGKTFKTLVMFKMNNTEIERISRIPGDMKIFIHMDLGQTSEKF